ncbi:MAG: hypothetical protein JOZ62_15180 [Acidobacteriaceae bacterium]|nr:hypothetical protein [Acidobacteriaceae bacterium]
MPKIDDDGFEQPAQARFIADEEETRAMVKDALMRRGMSEEEAERELDSHTPDDKPVTEQDIQRTIEYLRRREEQDRQKKSR